MAQEVEADEKDVPLNRSHWSPPVPEAAHLL